VKPKRVICWPNFVTEEEEEEEVEGEEVVFIIIVIVVFEWKKWYDISEGRVNGI
jgi:hypothetical protein